MVDFNSPYYPYEKVIKGANSLSGAEYIPKKLLTYLLDLPDKHGYEPQDDNKRPRVRFIKYLFYDGENPLSEALPTAEQKLSLLFEPEHPDINTKELTKKHPKGYRLIWQRQIGESQLKAMTIVKCYISRTYSDTPFQSCLGFHFDILTNNNFEANMKVDAYSRAFAIEQAIYEALNGVNIAGVGTVSFNRRDHADAGSEPLYDERTNVGRQLRGSILWQENGQDEVLPYCE